MQVVAFESLGSVADAELDAEVDPQSDEQHGERDRNQIQCADHHQPDCRRDDEAHGNGDGNGENDLGRAQRHPENEQHHKHGSDAVGDGPFLHRGELFVGDRHRAGQPDARAELARNVDIPGSLTNSVRRALARLQILEIEDRLNLDETAPVGIGERLVADQFAPRERRVFLVQDVIEGIGDLGERCRGSVETELPVLNSAQGDLQRPGQSPQARVARHDFQQRRRRSELAGQFRDFLGRQEQQTVLLEERTGSQPLHRFEIGVVFGQFLFERGTGGACKLGSRRLDDRDDQPLLIERLFEGDIALAPVKLGRDQLVDIGIDCEISGRINARRHGECHGSQDDQKGESGANLND